MYQMNVDEEDQAAILIQKGFRGLIGRKAFAKELLQQERGKRRAQRKPKVINKPQPQSHHHSGITSDLNDDVHVVVIQTMKKPTIIKANSSTNRQTTANWEQQDRNNSSHDSLDPLPPTKRNLTHIIEEDEDDLSLNDSLAINRTSNKTVPAKKEVLRQSKQQEQNNSRASWDDAEMSLEDSLDRHPVAKHHQNNHNNHHQQQHNDDDIEEEIPTQKVIVANKVRGQIPRAAPVAATAMSRVIALPLATSSKKEDAGEVISSGRRGQGPPSVRDLAAASSAPASFAVASNNGNRSGSRAEELQRMYRSDVVTQPKIKPQIITASNRQPQQQQPQPVIKAAAPAAVAAFSGSNDRDDDNDYDLYDNDDQQYQYQYQQQEDDDEDIMEEDELAIEQEYQNLLKANHKSHQQPSPPPRKKQQQQDDEDLQLKNELLRAKQISHQQQLQQLQQQKEAREQQEQLQLKRQQQIIAKKKKEQQELEEQQRKEQERLAMIKEKEREKERDRQRQLRRQQQQLELEQQQQQQQLQYEQEEQQQLRRRQQQQAEAAAAALPLKSVDLERKLLEEIAALDVKQRRLHEALGAHPTNNNNNQKHNSPKHSAAKQPSSARAAPAVVREKDPVKEKEKKAFGPGARDIRPTANRAAVVIPDPPVAAPPPAKVQYHNQQQQSKQKLIGVQPVAPPAPSPRAIVQEWKMAAQREENNHRPYPSQQDDSSSQGGGGYEQQFSIKRDYQAMPQAHLEAAPGYLHEFQRRKQNVILRSDSAKRDRQRRTDNGDDRSYHSAQEAGRRQQQHGQGQQHESASLPPLLPAQRNLQPGQQYQHPLNHVNRRVDSRQSNHSAPI